MKAKALIRWGLFLSVSLLASPVLAQSTLYVEGEVIVKFKGGGKAGSMKAESFRQKAESSKDMALKRSFGNLNLQHYSFKTGQSVEDKISELRQNPDVEYAEPNYILRKTETTGIQQSFAASDVQQMSTGAYMTTGAPIHAQESWSISTPSPTKKAIVAVIDTGLDTGHKVFADSHAVWTNTHEIAGNHIDDDGNGYVDDVHGWNFVSGSGAMIDDDGHGTHVAGTVLAVGMDIYNDPIPTSNIQIMPLKFLDGNGSGTTSNAISAIYYAVNNGASVLNNSWGGSSYSSALQEAVVYAYDHGVVFVAAAGNSGTNNDYNPMYPANYDVPNVISVAATRDNDTLASFSDYGVATVHLGSPGVYILSSIPGNLYGTSSGTSMATPFVSGTAALIKNEKPTMLAYQVKSLILNSADWDANLVNKVSSEARLNVYNAVEDAKTASVSSSQPVYSFSASDREPASMDPAAGCGLVSQVYSDFYNKNQGGGAPRSWSIFLILAVIVAPLIVLHQMRRKHPSQRRRFQRYSINSEVRVNIEGQELVGSISTISLGGVQLNTNALLSEGGVVSMKIASPDGRGELEVQGRIVWRQAQKSYGVQFREVNDSILAQIRNWTKALKPSS